MRYLWLYLDSILDRTRRLHLQFHRLFVEYNMFIWFDCFVLIIQSHSSGIVPFNVLKVNRKKKTQVNLYLKIAHLTIKMNSLTLVVASKSRVEIDWFFFKGNYIGTRVIKSLFYYFAISLYLIVTVMSIFDVLENLKDDRRWHLLRINIPDRSGHHHYITRIHCLDNYKMPCCASSREILA